MRSHGLLLVTILPRHSEWSEARNDSTVKRSSCNAWAPAHGLLGVMAGRLWNGPGAFRSWVTGRVMPASRALCAASVAVPSPCQIHYTFAGCQLTCERQCDILHWFATQGICWNSVACHLYSNRDYNLLSSWPIACWIPEHSVGVVLPPAPGLAEVSPERVWGRRVPQHSSSWSRFQARRIERDGVL